MPITVLQVNEQHPTVPVGEVIRTEPAAGDPVGPDDTIRLFVSLGPKPVKNAYVTERSNKLVLSFL